MTEDQNCTTSCVLDGTEMLIGGQPMSAKYAVVAMLARAVTYPATYSAAADPESYQYVRTVSGSVRCVISSDETACERTSAEGFPGAPASSSGGGRWNLAAVRNDGSFKWNEGNIGGAYIDQDLVLDYGRSYNIHGWTVLPNSDGTRFTNDVTGHGMFVSVQTVYSF